RSTEKRDLRGHKKNEIYGVTSQHSTFGFHSSIVETRPSHFLLVSPIHPIILEYYIRTTRVINVGRVAHRVEAVSPRPAAAHTQANGPAERAAAGHADIAALRGVIRP